MAAPLVISHRTNAGTAPPNSLAGIEAALRDRADGIEMDVRATGDGVPVLWHDATIAANSGADVVLADAPLATLRALTTRHGAAGAGIATLAEALLLMPPDVLAVLDIKERGLAKAVSDVVRASRDLHRCWIWAFDPVAAREYEPVLPEAPRALLVGRDWDQLAGGRHYREVAREFRCAAVSLEFSLVTAAAVTAAHDAGLSVYTWTVNAADEMQHVSAAGVEAVCTDFPRLAREVLAR
jgi:glycerophosphoryl diester phosphodiesterase